MTECYLGLGSNLEDRVQHIETAWLEINALANTRTIRLSTLIETQPVGPQDQPNFINAVGCIETTLQPETLLQALQHIEQAHGRVKTRHWGERTLDVDILLYGKVEVCTDTLTIPHPQILQRDFVLQPLQEIAAPWVMPFLKQA